ncbi:MAG: hypothetical protein AB1330_12345 [Bacillota bacterium]
MDIGHLALFILVAVFAIQLVRIITRPFRSNPTSRLRALRQRETQLRQRELRLRETQLRQRENQLRQARHGQFAKAINKLSPEFVIPRLSRISLHTFVVYAAAVTGAFVGFVVL